MTENTSKVASNQKKSGKAKDPLRATLNLPGNQFSMKANLLTMEPEFRARWERLDIHGQQLETKHENGPFVMHDGPPYANGKIHLGHLLNKVLKDIIVRSKWMSGYDVHYVPGWDCHGLPIEHQVMKNLGERAKELSTSQIRFKCEKYAEKVVGIQSEQMKNLGTTGDYANPYLTMKPDYEGATLEVFADLVEKGIVYRDLKPVHWSIANQTALADAELEYFDRKDTSIFVRFNLVDTSALPSGLNIPAGETVSVMIWTTTPWTLPANLAVAVAPEERYGLYRYTQSGQTYLTILGEGLSEKVLQSTETSDVEALGFCTGEELAGAKPRYQHPFIERTGPIVVADYVTMEDGTGLVHTAPGHGEEDYRTGLREGLEIYCPVKGDGSYDETVPAWLQGQDVWSANQKVVDHLAESKHLFLSYEFDHSYPHDWRSKTPTIFRATEQWFISVDRQVKGEGKSLREMALQAAEETINFVPDWGQSRLAGMLESRPDWCISRQRTWGLPIPAFLKHGEEPLLTAASVRAVAKRVREKGAGHWFEADIADLLTHYDLAADPDAPQWVKDAGEAAYAELDKSSDIFDVWFESGSSWNAVMRERNLGYPAEVYIEGSDQHRGWFQLSLLPALGATGAPPFKTLLTHGFIVDAQGHKMSKSVGNTIDVEALLKKHGADVCRWWVSSLNYTNDIKADMKFFATAGEEYRKIRNTLRFMITNLTDFDPDAHRYTFGESDSSSIDAWALNAYDKVVNDVREAFDGFQVRKIRDSLFNFCNETLSRVYFSAIKDRLYCDATDSDRRRRSQTALFTICDGLTKLLAPVIAHTADEAYLSLHGESAASDRSVHLQTFPQPTGVKANAGWEAMLTLRDDALREIESGKGKLEVKNSLDLGVRIKAPAATTEAVAESLAELADLLGVSQATLEASADAISVELDDLRELALPALLETRWHR